jgi:hypothetical protein
VYYCSDDDDITWKMIKMIGIAGFLIVWWLKGSIPLGVTGLLPIVLLPLFHISNGSKISQIYLTDSNISCFGSLIMAAAIELYSIHFYIADFIMRRVVPSHSSNGTSTSLASAVPSSLSSLPSPSSLSLMDERDLTGFLGIYSRIIFIFIFLTGFISMWLSNTATAALMLPISSAIYSQLSSSPSFTCAAPSSSSVKEREVESIQEEWSNQPKEMKLGATSQQEGNKKNHENLGIALDLSIAFAASLGGMATLTGTGSNLVFSGIIFSLFGEEGQITFIEWFLLCFPLTVIINLLLLWMILCLLFVWKLPSLSSLWLLFTSSTSAATSSSSSSFLPISQVSSHNILHELSPSLERSNENDSPVQETSITHNEDDGGDIELMTTSSSVKRREFIMNDDEDECEDVEVETSNFRKVSIKDSIETVEEKKRDEDDTMNRRLPVGYPEKVVVSSFCSFLSF